MFPAPPDPAREAVRVYLRGKIPGGKFEQVRWWPSRKAEGYVREEIIKLNNKLAGARAGDDRSRRRMLWAQLTVEEKQTDPEVIRVRYTAGDAGGQQVVYDGVFFLNPEGA